MTTAIGWTGLATSLVLVALALALSWWQGLHLERAITWSVLRAGVQLLVVGWALTLLFDPDTPVALAWLWVAVMVLVAAGTIRRRTPEVPGSFLTGLAALTRWRWSAWGCSSGSASSPSRPRPSSPWPG